MAFPKLRTIWKTIILVISIFLLFHFLKDITQDLLRINTILDVMGNIQEDTSRLHGFLLPIYYALWIVATIAQPVIGYLTYKTWKYKDFNKYDVIILTLILFFFSMLSWALILSK